MKIQVAQACQKAAEMFEILAKQHNVNIVGTIAICDMDLKKQCFGDDVPMQVTNFYYPKN